MSSHASAWEAIPESERKSWAYLNPTEKKWLARQPHILARGYQLRPRYRPGWQPSWAPGTDVLSAMNHEDFYTIHAQSNVMDATRMSDGQLVLMKRVRTDGNEAKIAQYFSSSQELRSDPRNHCVPVLDYFPDPTERGMSFLVMPLLREYDSPDFDTKGELMECFRQILEGLVFMHEHNVAHRDGAGKNIMMEANAMFPEGFHPSAQDRGRDVSNRRPKNLGRTAVPVTYYFVDFGISSQFPSCETREYVYGAYGRERTVPELSKPEAYDPFPVDVFVAGKLIASWVNNRADLEFLSPLVDAMTEREPSKRLTAKQAFKRFNRIHSNLSPRFLSSALYSSSTSWTSRMAAEGIRTIGSFLGF